MVALFEIVVGDHLISAFIVSALATIGLGLAFRELVKLDYSWSILLLSLFITQFARDW